MIGLPVFEIRRKKHPVTRKWRYWVDLIAENGQILSSSEMLTSDAAAMTNIESQMANVPNCEVIREWVN